MPDIAMSSATLRAQLSAPRVQSIITKEFRRTREDTLLWDPRVCLMLDPDALLDYADRYNESCDLSGEGGGYRDVQDQISAAIGALKRLHRELGVRAVHTHYWLGDDTCAGCGSDGRA